MPASHLSVICSSFAMFITTIKLAVPTWRLYHEYTCKNKPGLEMWLDASMSAIFAILSCLLLAFSLHRQEHGLQIVLSLAEGSTIVYQVGCLWMYRSKYSRALWAMLICYIAAPIIAVIPLIVVGHTKASKKASEAAKITLLSFFLAEYFGIFVVYLVPIWFEDLLTSKKYFLWNMGLSCVAWGGALASPVGYWKGKLDFITFLWVDSATAIVWVVWILWQQWMSLQRARSDKGSLKEWALFKQARSHKGSLEEWALFKRARSLKGSNEELDVRSQDDSPRQDSTTQLVVPSAVHYA